MGYFKCPIRRGRGRREKRALLEPARDIGGRWRRCERLKAPPRDVFLRFLVDLPEVGKVGLFRCSESLEESADLPAAARSQLRAVFRWFNDNLPAPRRLPRTAVCWFRADARRPLEKLQTLVELYRFMGHPVWMQATRHPGRIIYRDVFQVAAIAYPDRRVTSGAT